MNMEQLTALFADKTTTKATLVESFNQYQAHIEIEQATEQPSNLEQFEEAKAEALTAVDGVEMLAKDDIAQLAEEFSKEQWKVVNSALADLGKIVGFDHNKLALIDPRGRPVGIASNFARELFELALDDQIELDRGKECSFSPARKTHAKDFCQFMRGVLNYWQSTMPSVRKQWEEATRSRGAKTESVRALSKITQTNIRTKIG